MIYLKIGADISEDSFQYSYLATVFQYSYLATIFQYSLLSASLHPSVVQQKYLKCAAIIVISGKNLSLLSLIC
jgi:hypothetical protein